MWERLISYPPSLVNVINNYIPQELTTDGTFCCRNLTILAGCFLFFCWLVVQVGDHYDKEKNVFPYDRPMEVQCGCFFADMHMGRNKHSLCTLSFPYLLDFLPMYISAWKVIYSCDFFSLSSVQCIRNKKKCPLWIPFHSEITDWQTVWRPLCFPRGTNCGGGGNGERLDCFST